MTMMTNDFTFERFEKSIKAIIARKKSFLMFMWFEKSTKAIRGRNKSSIMFIEIYKGQFIGSDQTTTIMYTWEFKDVKSSRLRHKRHRR